MVGIVIYCKAMGFRNKNGNPNTFFKKGRYGVAPQKLGKILFCDYFVNL
jgi:hypothetical protein